MGVKVRKKGDKWYVFVDYHGRRKAKCVGTRQAAEQVKRKIEAKLALGEFGILTKETIVPSFKDYAEKWLKEYAGVECKDSTKYGYERVLETYLKPQFGSRKLNEIERTEIKSLLASLSERGLARGTISNVLAVIRGVFNYAVDDEILDVNPASGLGRFTRSARKTGFQAIALTEKEVEVFLEAAQAVCREYCPLFVLAVRAGLRRGELVAVRWGDFQFGADENDPNRYTVVQHNFVHRDFTTTKSRKPRRVDMSKQLRRLLLAHRDRALLAAFQNGQSSIVDDLVFPAPEGGVLDPDNLYKRYFLSVIERAGLRRFRLHDLRHTFGSLLIQKGASLKYVSEQMGHSSIKLTADVYGHLIPGADISWMDKLDPQTTPQPDATQTQPDTRSETEIPTEVVDLIGGGGWTRTSDLRIMRPSL